MAKVRPTSIFIASSGQEKGNRKPDHAREKKTRVDFDGNSDIVCHEKNPRSSGHTHILKHYISWLGWLARPQNQKPSFP